MTLPLGRLLREQLPQVCALVLRVGQGIDGDLAVYTATLIMLSY